MSTNHVDASIAHIHAPRFPEDMLEIIGNRRGLERLINALIEAVDQGRGEAFVRTADGYDSAVQVTCLDGSRRAEEWQRSGSPYWDIDDPFVARILDLTAENTRLRQLIASLRRERKSLLTVEDSGASDPEDTGFSS